MAEAAVGALHLLSVIRLIFSERGRRRRIVERAARRLGFSRKRAEGIARRVI